jgi:hypothetical protein
MSNKIEQQVNEIARAASLHQHKKISAVERRWQNIRYEQSSSNKATFKLAIQQEGTAIRYANEKLRNDYDLALIAVRQNGLALEYVSKELQNKRSICLQACQQNGRALEFCSESLKRDKIIITEALENNMIAIAHVPNDAYDESLMRDVVKKSVCKIWSGKEKLNRMSHSAYLI